MLSGLKPGTLLRVDAHGVTLAGIGDMVVYLGLCDYFVEYLDVYLLIDGKVYHEFDQPLHHFEVIE